MNWPYPALMLASVATGILVSRWTQRPLGLTAQQRLAIGLGAICGGAIAAKLPFVLADWDGLWTGRAWFENGRTLVMGLVGGYFGVEIAKWVTDVRIKTGDGFAVPVAAAVAVGRLACFVGGCCYGTPTELPWGVDFGDGCHRHPTQIYESAFHATCAVVLLGFQSRGLFRGQLVKLYIIAYLVYRFITEFIRPEPKVWLDLTIYQWAALAIIPMFTGLWVRDARSCPRGATAIP
jgi:phosphatidylglycerol---prolipoprotein diacylglyceryl transferase